MLWLPLFSLLAQSFAGHDCYALSAKYRNAFKRQLEFIVAKNPRYIWGGSRDIASGLDCSGYLYLAAKWASVPGVTRTTACRMAVGLGGWTSRTISMEDSQECDLIFWTFSPSRPHGHVGAFLKTGQKIRTVTHASSRCGVIAEPLSNLSVKSVSRVRRLTIGE